MPRDFSECQVISQWLATPKGSERGHWLLRVLGMAFLGLTLEPLMCRDLTSQVEYNQNYLPNLTSRHKQLQNLQ